MQTIATNVTCAMSIYIGDRPEWVEAAVLSVLREERLPAVMLIYFDGPVNVKIPGLIRDLSKAANCPVRVIACEQNMGRAHARQALLEVTDTEYFMLMDADDISAPGRLEKSLTYMDTNVACDVLGGQIIEFGNGLSTIRRVPQCHREILKLGKSRQPLNHVTMFARVTSLKKVGGYQESGACEDYHLIARLMISGMTFHNLPDVLVEVRVGDGFYSRRRSQFFLDQIKVHKYMLHQGFISIFYYLYISSIKKAVALVPGFLLPRLYALVREPGGMSNENA